MRTQDQFPIIPGKARVILSVNLFSSEMQNEKFELESSNDNVNATSHHGPGHRREGEPGGAGGTLVPPILPKKKKDLLREESLQPPQLKSLVSPLNWENAPPSLHRMPFGEGPSEERTDAEPTWNSSVGELEMGEYASPNPGPRSWEVARENVKIGKRLGSGRFGVVKQGEALNLRGREGKTTVAIKMLKGIPFILYNFSFRKVKTPFAVDLKYIM